MAYSSEEIIKEFEKFKEHTGSHYAISFDIAQSPNYPVIMDYLTGLHLRCKVYNKITLHFTGASYLTF